MIKRIIPWVLIMTLLLAGCKSDTSEPAVTETTAPTSYPMESDIYSPALDKLNSATSLAMTVTVDTSLKIGGETLSGRQNKQLYYSPDGLSVKGTVEYGTYCLEISEIYTGGMLYQTLNDSRFCASLPSEEYYAAQVPISILDPALYGSIMVTDSEDNTFVHFSQATQPEAWAIPEGAAHLSSQGSAILTPDGDLQSAEYELEYMLNQTTVKTRVQAQYTLGGNEEFPIPDAADYTPLEDIRGPLLIEQAYGFLQQTRAMDADLTEYIYSQANSLQYDNSITMIREDTNTSIDTLTTLTDQGRGGEVSTYRQLEAFQDGIYTICINDGEPEAQPRIDSLAMHTYCINLLSEKIMSSRHILQCTSQVQEGQLILTYTAGEALAETICRESCATLYQDENFLDSQTDHYEDYAVTFTLTVDPITGLPHSSGLEFHGIHHIDGINYTLETVYSQTYIY